MSPEIDTTNRRNFQEKYKIHTGNNVKCFGTISLSISGEVFFESFHESKNIRNDVLELNMILNINQTIIAFINNSGAHFSKKWYTVTKIIWNINRAFKLELEKFSCEEM